MFIGIGLHPRSVECSHKKDVRRGKFDVVCVWRFDRLARSVSHLLQCLEQFRTHNVEFISYSEAIDTATAVGKMTFTVLGAVAELERSITIERVRSGLASSPLNRRPESRLCALEGHHYAQSQPKSAYRMTPVTDCVQHRHR
jgi:DNA invertase Pin-like site-specific DNA recombinase